MTATLPDILRNRNRDRITAYDNNLAFYNGKQDSQQLRRPRRFRNITLNYTRAIILKTAAHVATPHQLQVTPIDDSEAAATQAQNAEDALSAAYADLGLSRLDYDTEVDTAVMGDGCYKITWDEPGMRPIVTAPDPSGLYPWPLPHDPTRTRRLAHRYVLQPDDFQAWRNQPAPGGKPVQVVEDWTADTWDTYINGALAEHLPNPYPWIPFIFYPNESQPKQWWGVSDIQAIRAPCQELNNHFTRLTAILEMSGAPITVLENVDDASGITTDPGAVWEIPQDAKAYLLDLLQGGGVRIHVDLIDHLYRSIHDLSEVPRAAFAGLQRDLSGVALQIELRPLEQKVARKRLIRDDVFTRRARMIADLYDAFTGTNYTNAGLITIASNEPVVPQDQNMDGGREVAYVGAAISSRLSSMSRIAIGDPSAEWERIKLEARELGEISRTINAPPGAARPAPAQPPPNA